MSSYLEIYLQKKKKEGEENEERLLLCSISRASDVYSLFRDNNIGKVVDNGFHEFTSSDFNEVVDELTDRMSSVMININHTKTMLPLISNKDSITDAVDSVRNDKRYHQELMSNRTSLMTLGMLFADIGQEWCDFDKLYYKIT